jgi:hypothetical protein
MTGTTQKPGSVYYSHIPAGAQDKTMNPEIKKAFIHLYAAVRNSFIDDLEDGIKYVGLPEAKQKAIETLKAFSDNSLRNLGQINLINSKLPEIYSAASKHDKTFNFEKAFKQYINELEQSRTIY